MTQRRRWAMAALEVVGSVAVATGLVAVLDTVEPTAGLGVIYLLSVLFVAIRRGQLAALASGVLSVVALNFFFMEPRHRLTISESENVVALAVFAVAAVVVGRLAAAARRRTEEAEERARVAAAREREAALLAAAAEAVLTGTGLEAQVRNLERSVARSASASAVRVELNPVPSPGPGETAVRLGSQRRSGWLYVTDDAAWGPEALERVGATLGRLVDVALEREAVAEQAAETETSRRADVAKTAVLRAISHDLRSPLTAITTAASGLRDPALGEDDRAELVAVIEDETSRLSRLVDDLLDLSKIEAGAAKPRPDWCDLREAVANAAAQVARSRGSQEIVLALPQDLPLVRADPAQLERVFANLLENAARFSPPGEPVRVTGGAGGGSVTVRVIDRGPGVPPSRRAQVFEPFFRGGDPGGGSGLGLAIARGFVEANGGRIRLQAGTPGETAFAVSFPLVRQPVAAG